jgi:tetratricopeptide (TPR) repeat protein
MPVIPDNDRLNLLLRLRRYADAERAARDAIGRAPDWAGGYTHLARALLGQMKKGAIDAAREGVRRAPRDAWAVGTLADVLNCFGRSREALTGAQEALRLDSRYPYAYCVLASVLFTLNRFADARATATEGLRVEPLSESLFRWKGWAEHKLGQPVEALRTAEEGLKHHPNSHHLLDLLGCIRWRQAERHSGTRRLQLHRTADTALRESVRLDPTQSTYRHNLRGNAVSCRKELLKTAVPVLMLSPFASAFVFALSGNPSLEVMDGARPLSQLWRFWSRSSCRWCW